VVTDTIFLMLAGMTEFMFSPNQVLAVGPLSLEFGLRLHSLRRQMDICF
jgi:hypothetical protein